MRVNRIHKHGEIGYWVNKKFWGMGYCSEALELMLRFCFLRLKLRRVEAGLFPGNPASARVLKKAGFKREGHFRKHIKKGGRWMDLYWNALLVEDWRARK